MEQVNAEKNRETISAKIIPLFKNTDCLNLLEENVLPFPSKPINLEKIESKEQNIKENILNALTYIYLLTMIGVSIIYGLTLVGAFSIAITFINLFEQTKPKQIYTFAPWISLSLLVDLAIVLAQYYITSPLMSYVRPIAFALLLMPLLFNVQSKKQILSVGLTSAIIFCACTFINSIISINPLDNALAQYYLPHKKAINIEELPKATDSLFKSADSDKLYKELRLARASLAVEEN